VNQYPCHFSELDSVLSELVVAYRLMSVLVAQSYCHFLMSVLDGL
jgi:hypothetical protein